MITYSLNLITVCLLAYIAEMGQRIRMRGVPRFLQPRQLALFSMVLCLSLVEGLRVNVGTDYPTYASSFSGAWASSAFSEKGVEIGFALLCRFLHLFSADPILFFIVTAGITNALIVFTLGRRVGPLPTAIFLYITSYAYYTSFNTVRQSLAVAVVFSGSGFLFSGKWVKYAACVLVASSFHISALVMLVGCLFVRRRSSSFRTLVIAFLAFLAAIYLGELVPAFFANVPIPVRYASYQETVLETGAGIDALRVIAVALPALVGLALRRRLRQLEPQYADAVINLLCTGTVIMLVALRHWAFARFASYFTIYVIMLVPMFTRASSKRTNLFVCGAIVVLYLAYSTALLVAGDGHLLPYQSVLTQ